jgi:tripartite-type tricarboxylate transporter receptor subunit TctC
MKYIHSVRRQLAFVAIFGSATLSCGALSAQTPDALWPTKPITWLVGYPPGGSSDVIARLVARRLEALAGQAVVVENRPGASGLIAQQAALKAPPDGYTVIMLPGPILGRSGLPEIGKEFAAVALLATGATVLVGKSSAGIADISALLDNMRRNPKAWSYASSGNGTGQHLAGELLNQIAGTSMLHIPYKGGGQAVSDVVSGQVPLAILGITPVLPHVRSGALRAYAVTSAARQPALPGVPTLAEAGLKGYEAGNWFVLAAPTGTPADRLRRLNAWIVEILSTSEVKEALDKAGLMPGGGSPEDVTQQIRQDLEKWKTLARRSNLDLE